MADWELLGEETVWAGWRQVDRHTYKRPDGETQIYEVMVSGDMVSIFPLTTNNQVVTAYQFRAGLQRFVYDLPGGGIDKGEEFETAAARELLEETGYAGELKYMGSHYISAYSDERHHCFLARNCIKVGEPQENPNEVTVVRLFPVDEFKKVLFSGNLSDPTTGYMGLHKAGLL